MRHVWYFSVLVVCAVLLTSCNQEEAREDTARRLPGVAGAPCYRAIDETFNIDGILDEESWKAAPKLSFHMSASPSSALAKYPGKMQAQWCWDDHYWYIAFTVDSPDINCPAGKKDWRSFTDDQVEVLIDPDGDGLDYCGMEIMPGKYVFDYRVKSTLEGEPLDLNAAWDFKGLQAGITVDGTLDNRTDVDRRWICEIAIPWAAFADVPGGEKPRHKTQWRVNLLGNDFLPPKGKQYIEFMWSQAYDLEQPSYKFHVPSRFGKVTFLDRHLKRPRAEASDE